MQSNNKSNIKSVLIVMLLCYVPHMADLPVVFTFVIATIVYRLIAERFHLPLPNIWLRVFLILVSLGLLYWQYRILQSSGFYIGCLLIFTALKSLEAHTARDLRVLVLCNFYVILTVLLLHQELWIFPYIILGVLANLALMVKLTAPQVDLKGTSKHFIKHFLIALPISLLLFYLFPRFTHPLWRVPALSQTKVGFNEEMTIGNLSEVFNDDSNVMRVVFDKKFKPTLYWRGLVLSQFNGWSWKPANSEASQFTPLKLIETGMPASYEIMLDPHQKKWLFYQDNPIAAKPNLLFLPQVGLIQQNNSPVYYRLNYSLVDKLPTYQPINDEVRKQNTYLPPHGNPKLRAWAKQQFAAVKQNQQAMIAVIARRIYQENYWYSLVTANTGIQANLMDRFWFETKRGYCEYYTGAVAIILRSVGIPARVIVGYQGGKWNPVAQYLTVQQNDAHAWLEYWQEGMGWQRLDPVRFINPKRIDPTIHQKQADQATVGWLDSWTQNTTLSWITRVNFMLESVQFFWERWLLFYNQDTQRALLQKMGLEKWNEIDLLQSFIAVLLVILAIAGTWYLIRQWCERDALLEEYHRLQHEMALLGIETQPPATLAKQLQELEAKYPQLEVLLRSYLHQYEQLRLHHAESKAENREAILKIFRGLRMQLKKTYLNSTSSALKQS